MSPPFSVEERSYDPSELEVLAHAFERAWMQISQSYPPWEREEARARLAEAVMSAARRGAFSQERIAEDALKRLRRPIANQPLRII